MNVLKTTKIILSEKVYS